MFINKNSAIATIGIIAIIIIAAVLINSSPPAKTLRKTGEVAMSELANLSGCEFPVVPIGSAANYDSLAKCLTDKGVKMYGAYWCGHCQNQKKAFGDSFKYINYIECADPNASGQLEVCKKEKIESYPTWEFPEKKQ